jgi:hypothetical protein
MADEVVYEEGGLRYKEPVHPYRLETFSELPPVIIGPDNRCTCTASSDECPRRRVGRVQRCTLAELQQLDSEAVSRRAWQSGDDY